MRWSWSPTKTRKVNLWWEHNLILIWPKFVLSGSCTQVCLACWDAAAHTNCCSCNCCSTLNCIAMFLLQKYALEPGLSFSCLSHIWRISMVNVLTWFVVMHFQSKLTVGVKTPLVLEVWCLAYILGQASYKRKGFEDADYPVCNIW